MIDFQEKASSRIWHVSIRRERTVSYMLSLRGILFWTTVEKQQALLIFHKQRGALLVKNGQ